MNIDGMLLFENMTADYIKETGNHVAYRVTPVFDGNDLVARGVLMEGWSIEDEGDGVCFCVFAYNVQPGIEIDYATGDSRLAENAGTETSHGPEAPAQTETNQTEQVPTTPVETEQIPAGNTYILNTNTKKFHIPSCSSVKQMKESNKQEFTGSREEAISRGYDPCKRCNP